MNDLDMGYIADYEKLIKASDFVLGLLELIRDIYRDADDTMREYIENHLRYLYGDTYDIKDVLK